MEKVKGFQDFIGEEALKISKIKRIIEDSFQLYGFEYAETPIIESESFVKSNNTNDEAVSEVFTLKDRGKRKLALRYEFTFQLKRISKNKKLPYKRYQIGPVFRDEPTSSNRFRQFTQADVDVIGSKISDEAEILSLVKNILNELKINSVIYINNRKLLNEILDEEKIKNKEAVIKEIDKLDKLSEKEIKNNLKKYKAEKVLSIFKKPESHFKKYESYKEILELMKLCKSYNVKVKFSPSLARGLSYYNGSIFEIKSPKAKETICAGGSYLINNIQSTGISFGIERLMNLSKIKTSKPILIISFNEDKASIDLAKKLRNENISCSIFYGKISKALEYANSNKMSEVIIIGEKEVKNNKYKLKDMKSGKEKLVSLSNLVKELK